MKNNSVRSRIEVDCQGRKHTVALMASGALVFEDHTRKELARLVTGHTLGMKGCGCVEILMEFRSKGAAALPTAFGNAVAEISSRAARLWRRWCRKRSFPVAPTLPDAKPETVLGAIHAGLRPPLAQMVTRKDLGLVLASGSILVSVEKNKRLKARDGTLVTTAVIVPVDDRYDVSVTVNAVIIELEQRLLWVFCAQQQNRCRVAGLNSLLAEVNSTNELTEDPIAEKYGPIRASVQVKGREQAELDYAPGDEPPFLCIDMLVSLPYIRKHQAPGLVRFLRDRLNEYVATLAANRR